MVYSLQERIELVGLYYKNNSSARAAARIFNETHQGGHATHKYVIDLMHKFTSTGSVGNKKHNRLELVNNEAIEVAVLGQVSLENQQAQSLTTISREVSVSSSTVYRILHKHKYHPYKIKLVQELYEDDFDRRLEFCELLSQRLTDNPHLLHNLCFSDECTFSVNGLVNRHNCRYWAESDPHVVREYHTQNPQKLNVWCGILGDHIVGPFFLDGNLNGESYLELLREVIDPRITTIIENDHNLSEDLLVFQQDGAPPHFALPVRQFLNETFPNRWIGRRGSMMEWPPRSPDLSPLDFFLWGYLKTKIYATQPESLEDLRQRIEYECLHLNAHVFGNVREAFQSRLYHCMEVNGGHFEQFL